MVGSAIITRLRRGVPSDAHRPPFDGISMPVYFALASTIAVTAATISALRFTVEPVLTIYSAWAVWLWFGGVLIKRVGHRRIGGAAEVTALVYFSGFVFVILIAALTAIAGADADKLLNAADRLLGFNWRDMATSIEPHEQALTLATAIYRSITWQPAVMVVLLFATGKDHRAWTFLLGWILALGVTTAIYPLFPAEGPMLYYGISQQRFPGLLTSAPWSFGPTIHALRDIGVRTIGPSMLVGLVTFPSFHVAAAVILSWAIWPIRWAGKVFLALNIVMAAASLICGPHYLVDALAGLVVAIMAIAVAKWIITARSLDAPPAHEIS